MKSRPLLQLAISCAVSTHCISWGGKTYIFYGLAYRIFGREHVRSLFADVKEMLVNFGYRDRTARIYVPRAMCEVLVTNRSPHLEDLTVEVLQKVFDRRRGRHPTFFLSVISKVLANRKIISAPIKRMDVRGIRILSS
jgi:hypothetical protein